MIGQVSRISSVADRMRSALVLVLTIALFSTSTPVEASQVSSSELSEYIVVLDQGVRPTDLGYVANSDIEESYQAVFNGYLLKLTDYEALLIKGDSRLISINKNQPIELMTTDDAQDFPPSWGLDRIDQKDLGLNQIYAYDQYQGQGVIAYIMDTGVDSTHPEFADRMLPGANFATDADTFPSTEDCQGHGTHVAGTVGGSTVGVAKKVSISPIRIFDCEGKGFDSNIISGLNWIYENHPRGVPAVINMSFGGYDSLGYTGFDLGALLISELNNIGVYSIAAAGNSYYPTCSQLGNIMPAALPTVIAVGAINQNDEKPPFSNYGDCLEVFAPGVDIYSAKIGGGYNNKSGTSMAAPHVTGAAARWISQGLISSFDDLKAVITGNATTIPSGTLGQGSPNKALFISGNVHVRADTFVRAKDDPGQHQLVVGGGQTPVTFSPSDNDQYSVSETGFLTLRPAVAASVLSIPVSATDGYSTSTSSITVNLRNRPTVSSQTYSFNRETFKSGSVVSRALQVQGEEVKTYLVDGQTFTRGVASVDPYVNRINFETNAIDADISWSEDIQVYGVDKYGISSFPAKITIAKACVLSPASYTLNFSGQVGSVAEIEVPTICGEVSDIRLLDDWESAKPWRNLNKPKVLLLKPTVAEVTQKRLEIADNSGNRAEVMLQVAISEAAPPLVSFDNILDGQVVHGNIAVSGSLSPGIGSTAATNKFCVLLDGNPVSANSFIEMANSSDSMSFSNGCISLATGLQSFIFNLDTREWSNGAHTVSVVAYSANGTNSGTKSFTIESLNSASQVSWLSATSGLVKRKNFNLEASATPNEISSQEIKYWCLERDGVPEPSLGVDGCIASEQMQATFSLDSRLWQDGEHTFTVFAKDQYGRKSNEDNLTLTTFNSPKISEIIAEDVVHGWALIQVLSETSALLSKICVKLDGSTNELVLGNISRDVISFDTAGCFTVEPIFSLFPAFNVDTTALSDGNHELDIVVFDELSRESLALKKQIKVANPAPSVYVANEDSTFNNYFMRLLGSVDSDGTAKLSLLCLVVDGNRVPSNALTVGGQKVSTDSDGCFPFSGDSEIELNTSGYKNGVHKISLRVKDSIGKMSPIVTQDAYFKVLTPKLGPLTSRLLSDGFQVGATLDIPSGSKVTAMSCTWRVDGIVQVSLACNPNIPSTKISGLKPGNRLVSLTTIYSNGDFDTQSLSIIVPSPKVTAENTKLKLTCSIVTKGKAPKCSIKATSTLGLTGTITVTPSYLSGKKWINLAPIKTAIGKSVSISVPKKTMTVGSLRAKAVISNKTSLAPAVKY